MDAIANAWKSLTIWFNAVLLSFMAVIPQLQDALPSLQPYLTPETYKWLGFLVLVGNIALRFKTSQPLSQK